MQILSLKWLKDAKYLGYNYGLDKFQKFVEIVSNVYYFENEECESWRRYSRNFR